jgi:mono/diheme cytochrome c family protein
MWLPPSGGSGLQAEVPYWVRILVDKEKPVIPTARLSSIPIVLFALVLFVAPIAVRARQHQEGAHKHPEAAKLKNPVEADEKSIAAGKKLYTEFCVDCHGETGKGDGGAAQYNDPKPPDLSDADWKHGSTDGEIYTVIREGVTDTGMRAFKEITPRQTWDLVNYVRSLGPPPAKSH